MNQSFEEPQMSSRNVPVNRIRQSEEQANNLDPSQRYQGGSLDFFRQCLRRTLNMKLLWLMVILLIVFNFLIYLYLSNQSKMQIQDLHNCESLQHVQQNAAKDLSMELNGAKSDQQTIKGILEIIQASLTSCQENISRILDNKINSLQTNTSIYEIILSQKSNVTALYLTCCKRHAMLQESLLGFLENNEVPVQKLIVVNDGPINSQLAQIIKSFPNVTFLSTGDHVGQIRAIDMALRHVDTPYLYYSEDDRKLNKSGLITQNIQSLEKDPKLLQVWNDHHHGKRYIMPDGKIDPTFVYGGFSFFPSVWRMSDYHSLKGGFTGITDDISRGTGAGKAEIMIVDQFKRLGYYVLQSQIDYNKNIGIRKGLPRRK